MSRFCDFRLPVDAVIVVVEHVRYYGRQGVETGAFLIAPASATTITTLALAGTEGIVRRRELFRASGRALERLFTWTDHNHLLIRAQIHSHRGLAFLSETDMRHGFSVDGFTTIVIPRYFSPPGEIRAWGWWRYEGGMWRSLAPLGKVPAQMKSVFFDEEGVREG